MLLGCHFRKTYLINLIFLQNKILSFGSQIVRGEKQGHTGWKKEKAEKEGQGGGVAECHPVIREPALLVHRSTVSE